MARQLRLRLGRAAPPSLAEFVRGASNTAAVAALEAWPAWSGGCLALVGPQGVGKSHLAQAWAQAAGALALDPAQPDLAAAAGRPVLLEDADRALSAEGLFHLINLAAREGGGLLLTARTRPATWPTDLPDLRSRLNALPVAMLGEPDDAVLRELLERFFRERNIRPAEDLLPYLVHRIERSAAAAREIVARLDETADAQHRAVTKALARRLLEVEAESDELFE